MLLKIISCPKCIKLVGLLVIIMHIISGHLFKRALFLSTSTGKSIK